MSNNLIVGYTKQDESRGQLDELFPFVDILQDGVTYTSFGSEPFTPNNELRYNTFQPQDNFTKFGKNHSLTFGGSIEKYRSDNVFFPGKQSAYVFNSLDDFYATRAATRTKRESELAALPGPVHQHPRARQAAAAARRLVQQRLRAGRVAPAHQRHGDGRRPC